MMVMSSLEARFVLKICNDAAIMMANADEMTKEFVVAKAEKFKFLNEDFIFQLQG